MRTSLAMAAGMSISPKNCDLDSKQEPISCYVGRPIGDYGQHQPCASGFPGWLFSVLSNSIVDEFSNARSQWVFAK
ncbi:MAG: hypothetical protein ABI475_03640 [Methylophilaceae bacterium]